jgi:hypothetical protein
MDHVHHGPWTGSTAADAQVHGSLIKPWLLNPRSVARIKLAKWYFPDLIYTVDRGADGRPVSSLIDDADEIGDGRNSMATG